MDFKIRPYCKISKKGKKKMKKLLLILLTILMLSACTSKVMKLNDGVTKDTPVSFASIPSAEELVTVDEETTLSEELAGDKYIITATKGEKVETMEFPVTFDTIDVDGTLPVDLAQFYSNKDKLANLTYTFNDEETIMTITDNNNEEPHTFDVPVNVIYPTYSVAEDITIDTYVGYDINEFVSTEEGVEVTSTLDEANSTLSITLSKNDWSVNETVPVTLTSSEPQYPLKYYFVKQVDSAGYVNTYGAGVTYMVFTSATTGYSSSTIGSSITWTIEGDYQYVTENGRTWKRKIWFEDDLLHFSYVGGGLEKYGVYTYQLAK